MRGMRPLFSSPLPFSVPPLPLFCRIRIAVNFLASVTVSPFPAFSAGYPVRLHSFSNQGCRGLGRMRASCLGLHSGPHRSHCAARIPPINNMVLFSAADFFLEQPPPLFFVTPIFLSSFHFSHLSHAHMSRTVFLRHSLPAVG